MFPWFCLLFLFFDFVWIDLHFKKVWDLFGLFNMVTRWLCVGFAVCLLLLSVDYSTTLARYCIIMYNYYCLQILSFFGGYMFFFVFCHGMVLYIH